ARDPVTTDQNRNMMLRRNMRVCLDHLRASEGGLLRHRTIAQRAHSRPKTRRLPQLTEARRMPQHGSPLSCAPRKKRIPRLRGSGIRSTTVIRATSLNHPHHDKIEVSLNRTVIFATRSHPMPLNADSHGVRTIAFTRKIDSRGPYLIRFPTGFRPALDVAS